MCKDKVICPRWVHGAFSLRLSGLKVCFGFALPAGGGGPAAQRRAEEPAEQLQRPRPAAPYTGHPGAGNSVAHRQTACCARSQGITASNKCSGLENLYLKRPFLVKCLHIEACLFTLF